MKRKLLIVIAFIYSAISVAAERPSTAVDVVEITATTLESVYYHQINFAVPTKLVFTNLTSVNGYVYFHQNTNLVEVDFPMLTQTNGYFYFHGNTNLETINAPNLTTVQSYLYVLQNTALTTLNVCGLQNILPDGFMGSPPYYAISQNTPGVDAAPFCFSMGGPQNFSISNQSVAENEPANTVIGLLSADSNYPDGTLTYILNDYAVDNSYFNISGNELRTNGSFDYETKNAYTLELVVRNQLGESTSLQLTVNVTDVAAENVTVIEITDATMANVYYHQVAFPGPTKLVFTNLTSVSGYVYFHQNINLVEVDFPVLQQTGQYFYTNGNQSLVRLNAPALEMVTGYLYVAANTSLTELNVCALNQIIPSDYGQAYYYIFQNTPVVDATPFCFTMGGPQNFAISNTSVAENSPAETVVGLLSADSNYPTGSLTYLLDAYEEDNSYFHIIGNELRTNGSFDFEGDNQYTVKLVVSNQIGETATLTVTINVTDVITETLTIIEITDATMANVYYHQVAFPGPTKLVFTNLTSVSGYVYFHGNINLVAVEFPLLAQTGEYFYCNGNQSLATVDAPALDTIHRYLYVSANNLLTQLNVCALSHILPSEDLGTAPYYYIENNPILNFDSTCLENTTIGFMPVPVIFVEAAPNTRIGTFTSDAGSDSVMSYFFVDAQGNPTTNTDFLIVSDGLYLANEPSYYANADFEIHIGALRIDPSGRSDTTGLNEKLDLNVTFNIDNAVLQTGSFRVDSKSIILFPNPATSHFEIGTSKAIEAVYLFDMTGRKLKNISVQDHTVDMSHLPPGNYLVVVKTDDDTVVQKMLVKN